MAFVYDPNFGNSIFAIPAIAPFPTGGGNRILNLVGAGVIYDNVVSAADVQLSCDFRVTTIGNFGTAPSLIARRQANGSMYIASVYFDNFSSGSRLAYIHKYNGPTNTLTSLAYSLVPAIALAIPPASEILTFRFRLKGNNFLATIFRANGDILSEVGTFDSTIAAAGNVGIGGNIIFDNDSSDNDVLADNFLVKAAT